MAQRSFMVWVLFPGKEHPCYAYLAPEHVPDELFLEDLLRLAGVDARNHSVYFLACTRPSAALKGELVTGSEDLLVRGAFTGEIFLRIEKEPPAASASIDSALECSPSSSAPASTSAEGVSDFRLRHRGAVPVEAAVTAGAAAAVAGPSVSPAVTESPPTCTAV